MAKKKTKTSRKTTKKKSTNKKQSRSKAAPGATPKQKAFARKLYKRLEKQYPDSHCALIHKDPFQLLIATILSAQCTDKRVNMVTPGLFAKYRGPSGFAKARIGDIEQDVRTTGFFRNKARNIQGASQMIQSEHGGKVPQTMQELLKLPGVARKTANVVLGNAFGINDGVVVDTHVTRLSNRLGLTQHKDPKKIELDLIAQFDQSKWCQLSHLLIDHGRAVCSARKPLCDSCKLADICPKIGVEQKK